MSPRRERVLSRPLLGLLKQEIEQHLGMMLAVKIDVVRQCVVEHAVAAAAGQRAAPPPYKN